MSEINNELRLTGKIFATGIMSFCGVVSETAMNVTFPTLMNEFSIGTDKAKVAPHWYIRHGARDRGTAFPIPVNLALKLHNSGKDVNFKLPWNRPHSGDYALDELFQWICDIME